MLISLPVGKFPGEEWLDHMVDLFLDLSGIPKLSSIMVVLVNISIKGGLGDSPQPRSSSTFIVISIFLITILTGLQNLV